MPKPDKPLLIFVPGLGAVGETYEPFLQELRKDHDVRVAELPKQFPERISLKFFFDPIDRAAGKVKRFKLLGHSLGGNTALAYAAHHPSRVITVVAVAPPVLPKDKVKVRGLARFRAYRRLQNFALGLWGGRPGHAVRTIRLRSEALAEGRRGKLYDWINQRDLRKELGEVRNATVLWARREEILARDHYDAIKTFPNIRLREIRGSHNNLALHPRPILKAVKEALDG